MEIVFANKELLSLYLEEPKGKQKYSKEIVSQFRKKVRILYNVETIKELYQFKGLNFEKLKGDLKGTCSIRLNDQYRLLFTEVKDSETIILDTIQIEKISKHYE